VTSGYLFGCIVGAVIGFVLGAMVVGKTYPDVRREAVACTEMLRQARVRDAVKPDEAAMFARCSELEGLPQ